MHNFFTIEIEAQARQLDFRRTAAADARAAAASGANPSRRWAPRFTRSSASSSARSLPSTPIGALLELGRTPRPVAF